MPRVNRERQYYDELVKLFPPPPYLLYWQVRPWLFNEITRYCKEHPDSMYRYQLIWLKKWNWDKET